MIYMGSKSPLHLSALKSLNFFLSVLLGSGKGKDHDLSISQQNLEAVGGKKAQQELTAPGLSAPPWPC